MSCLKKRKLPVKPWRVKEAEGRFFEGGILVEAHDILYSGKFDGELNLVAVGVETTKLKSTNIILSHNMRNDIMYAVALLASHGYPL